MSKESKKKKDVKKTDSSSKKEKKEEVNNKNKKKVETEKTNESKAIKKENKKVVEEKVEPIQEIDEVDYEYDEDLEIDEEFDEEIDEDDEEIEEEIDEDDEVKIELVENKKKEEKVKNTDTSKKEKNSKKEKIAEIEKKVKAKKAKTKKAEFDGVLNFFEKNYLVICGFIGGILLTTLVAFIIWPERIAALKNGEEPVVKVGGETYTADELYEFMKDTYSVSLLINQIDDDLLTKIYPEDEEMTKEVKDNADYYFNVYEQYYGYTQEQFLKENGFANLDAFLEYLRLDYRRGKYLEDYITKNLSDEEIQKYYDKNVFGDINTQHVLVEVSSSEDDGKLSDEDAKTLAEEIIDKLNDGTSWEEIQKKYKKKITFEDLGYQSWDASLEKSFMDALTDMDDNSYSKDPVKTSYGYHVIYRLDQKKAPKLKEVKETIIENLISQKQSEDANLLYKALISLREEKKIKFSDTVMKEKYEEYCEKYKD